MEADLRVFRDELLSFAQYGHQEMIGWILARAVRDLPFWHYQEPFEYDNLEHDMRLYTSCVELLKHLTEPAGT